MPPAKMAIAQVDKIEELWSQKFWEGWYKEIDKRCFDLKRDSLMIISKLGPLLLKLHMAGSCYIRISKIIFQESNLDRIFGVEAVLSG